MRKLISQTYHETVGPFIRVTSVNEESSEECLEDILAAQDMYTYDDDDAYERKLDKGDEVYRSSYAKFEDKYFHIRDEDISEVDHDDMPEKIQLVITGSLAEDVLGKLKRACVVFCLSPGKSDTLMIYNGNSYMVGCSQLFEELSERAMIGEYGQITGDGDYDQRLFTGNMSTVTKCLGIIS